jgi:hypothetical protein
MKVVFLGGYLMAISFLLGACSVVGIRTEENPQYTVLLSDGKYEIRKYNSYIGASVQVEGNYKESQNKAFRILAGYIFGKNKGRPAGAPVTVSVPAQKIAMTAPVNVEKGASGPVLQFFMPSGMNESNAPEPNDPRVKLRTLPERSLAVLRYSGTWSEERFKKHAELLKAAINREGYESKSEPILARYNAPWTPWFLRRNEVWIEISHK